MSSENDLYFRFSMDFFVFLWYYRGMAKVKIILAYITLLCFFSTEGILPIFADEWVVLHSLDELPSFHKEIDTALDSIEEGNTQWEKENTTIPKTEETETTPQFIVEWLPKYDETTNLDAWFDNMSALVRMGIVKRRIIKSLGLPWDNSVTVNIVDGTEIRTKDFEKVHLDTLTVDASAKEKAKKTFHFGLTGKHLIFSKAVEIKAKVSAKDGELVDIQVKHAGDKNFNTAGLSTHIETSCNADWSASIPSSSAMVENGTITFYTCGASTFILNAAGTSSAVIWLSSWSGTSCTTNGCAITSWADRSGNNRNGTTVLGTWGIVNYDTTNQLNFNPTVALSGAQINFANTTTLSNYTVFYVLKATDISWWAWLFSDGTREFRFEQWNNSGKYWYTHYAIADYATNLNTQWNKYQILRYNSANANTIDISVQMGSWRLTQTGWNIGRVSGLGTTRFSNTAASTNGGSFNIAEMLGYSGQLSATNLNRVESYLALKYGMSLDQTTATNYTLSDGSIAWNGTVAGTYKNDIAGIGRDDATTLNQKKSQSINNPGDIIVESTGGFTTNLRALTWANDGTATGTWITSEIPTTNLMGQNVYSRITREWKFQEPIADIGGVKISYPVTALPSGGTGSIYMLVDSDGNFSNGGTTFVAGTLSGSNYEFATNITNGYVITFAQSTGIDLWLKANSWTNCSTASCSVLSWVSQNGKKATGTNNPLYITSSSVFNFNPSISFNGAGTSGTPTGAYFSLPSGFDKYSAGLTTYVVARPTMTNNWARFFDFWNGASNNNILLARQGTTDGFTYESWNWAAWWQLNSTTGMIINNQVNIFGARQAWLSTSASLIKNGKIVTNGTTSMLTNIVRNNNYIGRSNWNDAMYGGTIAEVIIYNRDITAVERNKIETYLALKYGITLDQSTATNYTLSNNGSIAWNGTTAGTYKNDIAGIGRDDATTLNQKKSQSINNPGDIIVEFTGATLLNLRTLTWANDWTATGAWINTENPPGYKRISREWKFQEALGDIWSTKISYPASSIPTWSTGSIYLFVDIDGNFSTGSNVVTGSLVGANYEFGINMASGSYVTFGYKDLTPPIINISGVSSGSLIPIGNWAINFIYSDADSGISTGSLSVTLQRYNSTLLAYDSATGWLTESWSRTQSGSIWNMNNIGFWKYKLTATIADKAWNTTSTGIVFFIDQIEWTIDRDTYNVWDISPGISTFGTGQITITIKTVWAGFTLSSTSGNSLASTGSNSINYWNGTNGWWYDLWNGSAWTNTITSHSPNATLATTPANLNQNGDKNTYTYKIRYGTKLDEMQSAWQYIGTVNFQIGVSY
jgi:Concanavalin A-like lectin/glucanases superfamily/Bacterial Ig-like domain